jgi:hypothetical protein
MYRRWLLIVVLVVAGCGRQTKQEMGGVNPWCQFAPGSWVTLRTVVKVSAEGKDTERVTEQKLTLVEFTQDKVVLEQTTTLEGQQPVTERAEVPRALPPRPATAKLPAVSTHPEVAAALAAAAEMEVLAAEGEEKLLIDGRTIETHWAQYGKGAMTKKQWTSPDVPGPWCKLHMVMELGRRKQETLVEVIAFEKK